MIFRLYKMITIALNLGYPAKKPTRLSSDLIRSYSSLCAVFYPDSKQSFFTCKKPCQALYAKYFNKMYQMVTPGCRVIPQSVIHPIASGAAL